MNKITKTDVKAVTWCQQSGRRSTPSRRNISSVIEEMTNHFDADQLFAECRRRGLTVSRATVYRTLPLLCKAGMLRSTEFGDGRHLYSRSQPGAASHVEIYVADCGRVIEIPAPFLSRYAKSVTAKAGYELIGQRFQTFARCPTKHTDSSCKACTAHAVKPLPQKYDMNASR